MAEPVPLGELMSRDFVIFSERGGIPPGRKLDTAGRPMAVVVDPGGQVSGVWMPSGRGACILTWADTPAQDIAGSSSLMRELTRERAAIVVLSGDDDPAGVISPTRFTDYLAAHDQLLATKNADASVGDAQLPGGYRQSLLVIICGTCGWRNELRSWIEGLTSCGNPAPPAHVLTRP